MRTVFTILASFIMTSIFGQATTIDQCFTDNNPATKVSRLTYPFNKAERIVIVRYNAAAVQGQPDIFSWDTVPIIPQKAGVIDTTKFLARQQLTEKGIDSLLKIMNQRSKENPAMESIFAEPSNAILFIDSKGQIFEYLVICFADLNKTIIHSEMAGSSEINLGHWCKNKGRMLQDFFEKRGVETVVTSWD